MSTNYTTRNKKETTDFSKIGPHDIRRKLAAEAGQTLEEWFAAQKAQSDTARHELNLARQIKRFLKLFSLYFDNYLSGFIIVKRDIFFFR